MARMRGLSWSLIAPAVVISAPAPALAVDYLTPEQAQSRMFPAAASFETREVALTPEQQGDLAQRLGSPLPRGSWTLRLARGPGGLLGVVVVDEVVGKFERITYAVALGPDAVIHDVEVLSYRESHGQEIMLPAWRRQFTGKNAAAPLQVGKDIASISGATLSCTHVTQGVRRIAALVEALRSAGELR